MIDKANKTLALPSCESTPDQVSIFSLRKFRLDYSILLAASLNFLACKNPPSEQEKPNEVLGIKEIDLADSHEAPEKLVQVVDEGVPEVLEEKIELPEIKFLDEEVSFDLPPGIKASKEGYHQAAEKVAKQIINKATDLKGEIKSNPKRQQDFLLQFLDEIVEMISQDSVLSPYFKPYLTSFENNTIDLNALRTHPESSLA